MLNALAHPHVVAFADIHVAFCNETVQITTARTAMHVIMNAGRLFVSVPSAGNIGHFEFSIFNALVSPFAGPSSLDVSSHPSCSSSFPFPLPPPSSCRSRTRERIIQRECRLRENSERISNFWKKFGKNTYEIGVNIREGIERKFDAFSQDILSEQYGNSLRDIAGDVYSSCAIHPLPGPLRSPSHPTYERRFLFPRISYFSPLVPLTPTQESISRMDDFYGR